MSEFKVIIEGYARKAGNQIIASSSVYLIRSNGRNIITDPGCNRRLLISRLKDQNLTPQDIHYVFLSHGHMDHIALCALFENAALITYDSGLLYESDRLSFFEPDLLGDEVRIISTPGHTEEHLSLLVDTDEGVVAVAGDVFWSYDGEKSYAEQTSTENPQKVWNPLALELSRNELLRLADWIIPGHGKKFPGKKLSQEPMQ